MDRIFGFRYFAPFRDGENKMWKTHPQPPAQTRDRLSQEGSFWLVPMNTENNHS